MDRAEIFETLAQKLNDFRSHGGGTVVDSTGMFHGRDVPLLESLSRSTGVHLIASTGLGPEDHLGGYFLTPQTNPPTPWPAEKFEKLFADEINLGMVVPRVERRGPAGLACVIASRTGMTPTEEGLFRGAARAAHATNTALSIRFGQDPLADLDIVLSEGIGPDRVLVGNLDLREVVDSGATAEIARRGAYIGIDHIGLNEDADYLTDRERVALIRELIDQGLGNRVLLSTSATGVAKGHPGNDIAFSHVLSTFIPFAREHGLREDDATLILERNPQAFLTGSGPLVESRQSA